MQLMQKVSQCVAFKTGPVVELLVPKSPSLMPYTSPQTLSVMDLIFRFLLLLLLVDCVSAHVAAWHRGMYCLNGTKAGVDDQNTNAIVMPLYQVSEEYQ